MVEFFTHLLQHFTHINFVVWMRNVSIIDEFIKGILIGILVSAPLGPVGILIIQRTLNKGRIEGLATGIGAALSDILYAIITGFGFSIVLDFVSDAKWAFLAKLIGGVVLLLFGIFTFFSRPKKREPKMVLPMPETKTISGSYILSGFMITLANPFIIVLFMALFGQFTFIVNDNRLALFLGYVGILSGCVLWWVMLTWLIDKVRRGYNENVIVWVNKIIGIIVTVVSILILMYALLHRNL